MTRKGYTNVSLPNTLIAEIDKIVSKKIKGYTSRAEYIKDAIRSMLKGLRK